MSIVKTIQMGKNGLTDNFLETLKDHFKKYKNIKISVLKSATRDREELKEISEKLLEGLGNNYILKTIGYTIILKKWRKPVR
jgi:RNA-binding protein YhbY